MKTSSIQHDFLDKLMTDLKLEDDWTKRTVALMLLQRQYFMEDHTVRLIYWTNITAWALQSMALIIVEFQFSTEGNKFWAWT